MQLAEAAAIRAMAAHDQSQPTPEHQPQPPRKPAPTAKSPTPEPTTRQSPPTPQPNDPDLAFARHSRSVRQSVELWEKITNNVFARPQFTRYTPSEPEDILSNEENDRLYRTPRPPFSELDAGNLYEAIGNLALLSPTHEISPETLTETIEQTLTAHPDDHLSTNFVRVCEIFGIPPNRHLLMYHLETQLRPPPDLVPKLE